MEETEYTFWSSADLTGNQTHAARVVSVREFWSSADLTGNQTAAGTGRDGVVFWSSADLTGNQTGRNPRDRLWRFGAVPI